MNLTQWAEIASIISCIVSIISLFISIKALNEIINIKISINSKEHNVELANNIMRCVQEEFKDKKNITVKFEA